MSIPDEKDDSSSEAIEVMLSHLPQIVRQRYQEGKLDQREVRITYKVYVEGDLETQTLIEQGVPYERAVKAPKRLPNEDGIDYFERQVGNPPANLPDDKIITVFFELS